MKRWLALLGCFIGMAVSVSSTLLFPFGLFMASITTEFGWTRTQFSSVLAIVALCNVVVFPIAGWAVDRVGPIKCILAGLVVAGICQACLALVNGYGAFVALDCAASAAGCFALYPAYFAIVRGGSTAIWVWRSQSLRRACRLVLRRSAISSSRGSMQPAGVMRS